MAKTPQEMLKIMIGAIEGKTGKTFKQWVAVAKKTGIDKHKALTEHMKKEHGLDHNQAQWIAWSVTDPGRIEQYDKPKDLIADLYSGKKAALRPIYDKLFEVGTKLDTKIGSNVCKTYTSLSGKTQFAIINPRTQKSVDLELALPPGIKGAGRLETFKSSNPKFTHRIRISDVTEIDAEVLGVMKKAYENNR